MPSETEPKSFRLPKAFSSRNWRTTSSSVASFRFRREPLSEWERAFRREPVEEAAMEDSRGGRLDWETALHPRPCGGASWASRKATRRFQVSG
eukprot:CAMPEP_0180493888 /NCGR_PEP_ID=MMETSP1036_2-20121128/40943_1 /TAXON_ID=632150 /ORGANISM="Azadinium spinosum, Strain 3D9" /LENGTH=92 /DNA_ID=CAMNT_0022502287 /DNA_START=184 /DNA_END=462 /DNA_ORIENTATION=+